MASASKSEFFRGSTGDARRPLPRRVEPGRLGELLRLWQERRRYRADLRRLAITGAHLVADIGLLPVHAAREAQKPFWQA